MKVYTSYWAQVRNFPKNLLGLNTTVWPPKWRPLGQDKNGVWVIDCPPLKPGRECEGLCNGKCEPKHPQNCKFLEVYYEQLMRIDFNEFVKSLNKLAINFMEQEKLSDVDIAFIVFEKYDNPCSERWPLQTWLRYYGMDVKEWGI